MAGESFGLDTNVLVYAVDSSDAVRQPRAAAIVREAAATGRCSIGLPSVGEFYSVTTRKGLVPRAEAAAVARGWLELFRVVEPGAADAGVALQAAATGRFAYWDALLLASLGRAGCTALLSEDMGDGASLAGVEVRDPFAGDELPARVASLLAGRRGAGAWP